MDKQPVMRSRGVWVLGLLLWTVGLAWGQATTVVTATADLNGSNGPQNAYNHQDAVYAFRGQVSLREALAYANQYRVKVGRRVSETVDSSALGLGAAGQSWSGGPGQEASPFSCNDTDALGGTTNWYRLGNTIMPPGAKPAAPFFTGLPNWGNNGSGGGNAGVPGDDSSSTGVRSRVLVDLDNAGYGQPHTYAQSNDNNDHNNVQVTGHGIRFQNLGFNIPSGTTITGIDVRLYTFTRNGPEAGPSYQGIWTSQIRLLKAGAAVGNSPTTSRPGETWSGDPDTGVPGVRTYGANGDNVNSALWGTTWSPADINDPTFGFVVNTTAEYSWHGSNDANNAGRAEQWAIIDHVEVVVYVNPTPSRSALVKADDTQRISCTLGAGGTTQQLVLRDWRFTQPTQLVPDDARITGVACRIVRCTDVGVTATDVGAVLQRPAPGGGAGLDYSPLANAKTAGGNWPQVNPSGYETAGTYGGAADTWGFTDLTGADINDPRFGVCFVGQSASGGTVYVNYAELSIWWEDPASGTQYIHNDLTITLDSAKSVSVVYPTPLAPQPLPAIVRDNVTLNGEINGDGSPDLSISCAILATNTAPSGVLTTATTNLISFANYGLCVGSSGTRSQNVVIEGVFVSGAASTGSSAWVPAVWLRNGHNIKMVNSDVTNCGIGVLTSVATTGGVPDKAYIGSQTPGSECSISNCVNAGIYTVGAGQTLVQRTTITDNGTSPGGLDPYSANVVLAGIGDNVLGGTAAGAGNTIRRASATVTSISGSGYGVTVPGTGQNTIQNNNITDHLASGVWICSSGVVGLPGTRTKPYPTIIGGSATNAGNTITGNGAAPATNAAFTNHAGIWVTGLAGDDSENPTSSPYKDDYNLIQGNTITGSGGAGIFLDGPGKTRVGGVATTARNTISNNGSLNGANGLERSGIEIQSTGQHYGDRQHPLQTSNPNEVHANIIENNNVTGNNHGINIIGTDDNLIGGAQAASLNAIYSNGGDGIRIQGSGDTVVTGNYVGVARDGGAGGNSVNGIEITAGATGDNQIGGQSVSERNVISGNGSNGISILGSDGDAQDADPTNDNDGSNRVIGNYIGLTPSGLGTRGNGGNGIAITQQSTGANQLGGAQPGDRNFIGGNGQYGISIEGDASGSSNVVKGNFIGLDDGDQTGGGSFMPHAASNANGGILVNAAAAQVIGGSTLGDGNFISANNPDSNSADGIQLTGAGNHVVLGNAIGGRPLKTSGWPADPSLTTVTFGNNPFANGGAGVFVDTASIGNITVGGTGVNDGNTIVWNRQQGINMAGTGVATVINNLIGAGPTASSGSNFVDLGNNGDGVLISGAGANVIGGSAARQANVISGNGGHGINIPASGNNTVERNKIGLDDTGQLALGNDGDGIHITGTGTNSVTRNAISGNGGSGVYFRASGALTLLANYIGTNITGDDTTAAYSASARSATVARANTLYGVYLPTGHTGKLVLGDGADTSRNLISGNTQTGIQIQGGQINDIDNNFIGVSSDGSLAIGNGGNGVYVENWVQNHAPAGATSDITLVGGVITWGNVIRRNVISGNTQNGVYVRSGSTVISANAIGLTPAGVNGTLAGNTGAGILVDDSNLVSNRQNVIIGAYPEQSNLAGGAPTAGNVITANGNGGIRILQAGGAPNGSLLDDVVIRANHIGVHGTLAAGNTGSGIYVARAVTGRVQIGDTSGAATLRNTIGNNTQWGIQYLAQFTATGSPNNSPLIWGNHIGTDVAGNAAQPNTLGGVQVDIADATRVVRIGDDPANPDTGRALATAANVISGNSGPAVHFASAARGYVYGNAIGLAANGTGILGNAGEGVLIDVTAAGTVSVGGADGTHRLRNIFVGNGTAAVAGTPRAAVTLRTGVANIDDNLFGYNEGASRVPQLLAGAGNDGGGVWLGQAAATGTTFTIPANTAVEGSGTANAQPGVRVDTDIDLSLTGISVHGGAGAGYEVRAAGDITLTNCGSSNNAGDGVLVTAASSGALQLTQCSVTGNTGRGIASAATGSLVADNDAIDSNTGGGVAVTGSGAVTVTNSQVNLNGTGGTAAGLSLTGAGTYAVRQSTIAQNGGDGLTLGVAGGQVCTAASIGLANNGEYVSNSTLAGRASGNNANLIDRNGGWGVNIANGANCLVRGNLVTDNTGGGINGTVLSAPTLYFNGLIKPNATTVRVSGKAPANTRVEVYEAKDPAIATPSAAGHLGQAQKRLTAVTADGTGSFTADIPSTQWLQSNDDLKLVTGLIVDSASGNTAAYARNTGQPNLLRVNGNPVQSRIAVSPKTIQAENTATPQQSTVTLTLSDLIGTPLAAVPNTALHIATPAAPRTPEYLTMTPAEGTAQTTSALSSTTTGGTITALVSAKDRVNCTDTVVTFGATVAGTALNTADNPPAEVLTITAGNPQVSETTLAVDPFADPATQPVADGTSPATLRISIHDNSVSHCVLAGFSRDRVRVVQVSGPAGGTATIGAPAADSDANGQLTVLVTATKAGTYVFGVQTDVAGDGFQSPQDDMLAANNKTVEFKPGPIDATVSDVTADKTTALANGGKRLTGAADAANTVTLSLTVYDGSGNAPVPNLPVTDIHVTGAAVGSSTPYTTADGVVVTVNGPTDANGQTTATVTSTKVGIVQFTTRVDYRSVTTTLTDKPQVDFRAPLSAANSSVTVGATTLKADDTDTTTMTITVKDGSDTAAPVANLPASAITITPNPASGVVISGLTATNAQGVATASIKGNMAAVPVDVTFTVTVAWPAAGQPAAGIAQVPSITLTQQPTIRFTVGDGTTIVLTADRTTLRPNGRDTATLTALLGDRLSHPIPGQTVTLSVADGRGVAVAQSNTTTNASGIVTATVTATQRNVPGAVIQASLVPAGGVPQKLAEITLVFRYPDPDPAQSTLTHTADDPLLANNLAKVTGTIEVRDNVGSGDPIPGIDPSRFHVDVFGQGTTTAATGVTVNLPTVATDAAGQTTFTATSTKAQTVTFQVRVDKEDGSGAVTIAQTFDVEFVGYVVQTYTPGLHMMGVGATPRDTRPQAVLANAANFDLATWLGAQQTYMVYSPSQNQTALQMVPGRGFWLQLQNYLTLTVVGDLVDQNQPFPVASQAPMPLSQGWNMVANPYPVPYNFTLSRIDVYRNGALVGNLGTAAAQALVEPYGWRWDPALQYLLMLDPSASASGNVSGTVQAGRGWWWLCNAPNVSVRLQAPVSSGRAETRAAATAGSWVATIDAATTGGSSEVFIGAGDRRLRAAAPPDAPVSPVIRAEIVDEVGRAASDVRTGPFTKKQTWNLNVTAAGAGDVTLSWKGLTRGLPAHHRLTLVDPTNGKRVVMNSRAAYTYSTTGGTRAFAVELDPHGSRSLSITDVRAGLTRSRAQGVPISVTLSADARVALTIKGLGGRVVRQLTADGVAGANALAWDGKDSDGRLVPAGSYMVEVTAYTDEGEMAKQVVNVTVR